MPSIDVYMQRYAMLCRDQMCPSIKGRVFYKHDSFTEREICKERSDVKKLFRQMLSLAIENRGQKRVNGVEEAYAVIIRRVACCRRTCRRCPSVEGTVTPD